MPITLLPPRLASDGAASSAAILAHTEPRLVASGAGIYYAGIYRFMNYHLPRVAAQSGSSFPRRASGEL